MSSNAVLSRKVDDLETRLAAVEARLAALTTSAAPATAVATKGGKPKKEKKAKDPDAPKRPASAYIRFSVAKRPEVVAANPTAKLGDIAKLLGAMWKALSADEQATWKAPATE